MALGDYIFVNRKHSVYNWVFTGRSRFKELVESRIHYSSNFLAPLRKAYPNCPALSKKLFLYKKRERHKDSIYCRHCRRWGKC